MDDEQRWRTLSRTTGVCGLTGMVLLFAPIIAISSQGEPLFDATEDEAAAFFRDTDVGWVSIAGAVESVGMLALLWYFVGLTTLLRRVEGPPAWRATVALVSGALLVAYGLGDVSWDAAAIRGDELDASVALFAFDVGNLGFANTWLAIGSFCIAAGWVLLDSRAVRSWWAWWIIAAGVGLVVARFAWESGIWYLPYALFWVWVVAFGIRLIRRPDLVQVGA